MADAKLLLHFQSVYENNIDLKDMQYIIGTVGCIVAWHPPKRFFAMVCCKKENSGLTKRSAAVKIEPMNQNLPF